MPNNKTSTFDLSEIISMTVRKLLLCIGLLLSLTAFSQKEWSNWFHNGNNMLTFKNGYPENVTNFITNPPPVPPSINAFHFYYLGQGGISYADPVTGATRFIISQKLGYSNDFNFFPSGTFLRSCPPEQNAYQIIPFSNDPDKFYVIQFQSCVNDLIGMEVGLQVRCPNAIGLGYSILDMRLNGGRGEWVSINNVLNANVTEQITMVKHANGRDVWIVVHPYSSSVYKAFLMTDAGVQTIITNNIGAMINSGSSSAEGNLTASHDGKMLAGSRKLPASGNVMGVVELFDFNNQTGVLSNYRLISTQGYVKKLTFSPDNTKLYGIGYNNGFSEQSLTQWDFNETDVASSKTTIYSSPNSLFDMQLAPDAKIYLNNYTERDSNDNTLNYLPVIQCPNLNKYACNFILKGFRVPVGASFPLLINDFIHQPRAIPKPTINIGNDTTICFGSFNISAPQGWQSYRWSTGDTTRSITVTLPGTYYVLVGNTGFSCPEAFGYIKVSDAAIKLNLGRDTLLCPGGSYSLHIPNDYSNILWANGSTVRDSIIRSSSNIIIKAKDINGCNTADTIQVGVNQFPVASFGPDTIICRDQTLLLQMLPTRTFVSNAVYIWQNNSTLDTFRVRQSGLYWGKVTYRGCTASDTINVQFINQQSVRLPNDTTLCNGDSLMIATPLTNVSYLWNTGATTQSIKVFNSGNYSLRVTNNVCYAWDTVQVNFVPRPVFSLGNDTSVCAGKQIRLSTDISTASYLWNTGGVNNFLQVYQPGLYWLKVSRQSCSYTDSIYVILHPLPLVNLGADTTLCDQAVLQLNVANPNSNYQWQNGSVTSSYTVDVPGIYYVHVVNEFNCTNTDTVAVRYLQTPVVTLGNDTFICAGNSFFLNALVNTAVDYRWQDGSIASSFNVSDTGIFTVTVSNFCGTAQQSVVVRKGLCKVSIPNSFSPNNDLLNDVFKMIYPYALTDFRMIIYNRFGQKIFTSVDMNKGWDGNFSGKPQTRGVYVWVISFKDIDGETKNLKGTVYLYR